MLRIDPILGRPVGVELVRAKLFGLLPLSAVIVAAAYGCASQAPTRVPIEEGSVSFVIRISGAGGTTGVLQGLAEEYALITNDVPFEFLEGSGSAGGVQGVNANLLDLAAMSRLPKDSELETGIGYIVFAEERVAVVTSPDLFLSSLTVEQVRGIFTGEINNWSLIGGPDADIRLITREEDDSDTKIIRAGILGDAPFSKTAVLMASEADAKYALNNASFAIGYLAYSGIAADGLSVHVVALNGQHPADVDGEYPLPSRRLGVAFPPEKAEQAQGFVDFLTGPAIKEILAKQGLLAVQ